MLLRIQFFKSFPAQQLENRFLKHASFFGKIILNLFQGSEHCLISIIK